MDNVANVTIERTATHKALVELWIDVRVASPRLGVGEYQIPYSQEAVFSGNYRQARYLLLGNSICRDRRLVSACREKYGDVARGEDRGGAAFRPASECTPI